MTKISLVPGLVITVAFAMLACAVVMALAARLAVLL